MNLPEIMKRFLGFSAITIALLIGWSAAYWFTSMLYGAIHYLPHEFPRQLINSFLGFFLFGIVMYLITRIRWVKSKQDKFLHPIIQALRMIAEGNFNIDLSYYRNQMGGRDDHPYYKIIESINHMADKLGEMEEMRQEFISNVSHEIQSPLTSISGFAYALKNDDLSPEERSHYLQIIETESIRLSKLSENLLKLTSLESDHLSLELKNYRLDHQLRRIILAFEPLWAEKAIHMDISLENITILADEDLMDQVWINLLHNCIKFTPNGGTIKVESYKTDDSQWKVKIKDTGIGMNNDTLMHIFERFYKADPSRNSNSGGSGLGLSIVKKIIDLHQGEIQVLSELGKGTVITVSLTP
ncbi:HAMP domain-containing sensor histidine kinase [Neobacillus sp. YX16]|uniref:sensor histidine kinase n=1 Tax=Neobacillus sp. YX16 TaxID=3047874 RepID=UPI0024C37430|nr:HAMP domain-containing sensor histidine kinase [Neobacillus sp. YX16]WHZ02672.1 HAMP domain-containing sensor histidine kinase [Neobacillus sp. YX16]